MQKKLNAGIVAFGDSGRAFHAPFIHASPDYNLVKVVERYREESKKIYPYVEVVKDLSYLLDDSTVDLIIITTPNPLHYDNIKQSLNAGKHVVVEKPFTSTTREAMELIELAKKQDRVLPELPVSGGL